MILGIDTSLGTAVAVVNGAADAAAHGAPESAERVHAEAYSADPLAHAEVIGALLAEVTAEAAIDHVAVGMGPGPFTGLRVGIAAARAFAVGRGLPVVPVPSHDAAALAILEAEPGAARFAVVTDARRRELAYSVYEGLDDEGIPVRLAGPTLVARDGLHAVLAASGATPRETTAISAAALARCAARAVAAGRTLTGGEPLYLRAPDVTLPAPRKKVGA